MQRRIQNAVWDEEWGLLKEGSGQKKMNCSLEIAFWFILIGIFLKIWGFPHSSSGGLVPLPPPLFKSMKT